MGAVVGLHPEYRLDFMLPANCDGATKASVERAAMRMSECRALLLDQGNIAALLKLQTAIADAITAQCDPVLEKLVTRQPVSL
jgi:hypothetical protein